MDKLYDRVAGIDISRDYCDVHIRDQVVKSAVQAKKRFSTMTASLLEMGDWLEEQCVQLVVIEATGIYWRAIYYSLEPRNLKVHLVNANHVKNVPGRKTDMADAQWLADVAAHGMVRPSFIPPPPIRAIRELTRHRTTLVEERSRLVARIEKMLQDAGIKITSVASSTLSVSSREMLDLLIKGERDPAVLAACAKGSMRNKTDELALALAGNFADHHGVIVGQLLSHIDGLDSSIDEVGKAIDERLEPYRKVQERLQSIPGVGQRVSQCVIGEVGIDMSPFPSAGHFSAWAGLAPANNESGGKRKSAGTRKGAPHLRPILVQAAWAAVRVKGSYYGAMFRRLRSKGVASNVAIVAVARKMAEAIWHMLTNNTDFVDLGADYYENRKNPEIETRRLVKRLQDLGNNVVVTPLNS